MKKTIWFGLCGILILGLAGLTFSFFQEISWLQGIPITSLARKPSERIGFPVTGAGNIYFASPAAVDLDQDGKLELLTAGGLGCVFAWRENGQVSEGYPLYTEFPVCDGLRINGPIAAADIDQDGTIEIAAGNRGPGIAPGQLGKVFVWHANGVPLPGWPQEMIWSNSYGEGGAEVYSVALGKIVNQAGLQILAGTSNNGARSPVPNQITPNLFAWNQDGVVLPGFPNEYKGAGIWGHIGLADMDADGISEVFTGRDHIYLHAYSGSGAYLPGWPIHTYVDVSKTTWNVDPYLEFTRNAPVMGDLDLDGQLEIAAVGVVRDPKVGHNQTVSGLIVVGPDGKRKPGWEAAQLVGKIISSENPPSQAPALADLDGDKTLEIVAVFSDGVARAYRYDGSLLWSYDFSAGKILSGSEPVIGDVTGDGHVDILFGTYSPIGDESIPVHLIGLDRGGNLLPNYPLELPKETGAMRGLRAAPTLADLDGDCKVEIAAASQAGYLYVWNTFNPYFPNLMPWFTSRHDNARTGAASGPPPPASACPPFNLKPKAFFPALGR